MHLPVATLFDFASTIAVLALLAVAHGVARDRLASGLVRESLLGLLFGLSAVGAMLDPLVLADGVLFDMRNLPIGLAGAFIGPVGALVAMVLAAVMRISLGGDGMVAALTAMVIAGAAGMLWRHLADRLQFGRFVGPLLLGALISLHLVSIAGLPRDSVVAALQTVAPTLLLLNLAGSLVISSLIAREDKNLEQRERLDFETVTDPLTGIANRRGFERRAVASSRPRRTRAGNAVLMIDIDHFKTINDDFGHTAGDDILRQIGRRLGNSLREGDVVARFGGEEFAVYLADMGRGETELVADRLRRTISDESFAAAGRDLTVTISVGVHWQADPVIDWDAILNVADRALYAAKSLGRDRVVFDDAMPLPVAA